jgi:hypothetical protein
LFTGEPPQGLATHDAPADARSTVVATDDTALAIRVAALEATVRRLEQEIATLKGRKPAEEDQ